MHRSSVPNRAANSRSPAIRPPRYRLELCYRRARPTARTFREPALPRQGYAPELGKDKEGTPRYEEAHRHARMLQLRIEIDLNDQLVSGKLIARGFREPFTPGARYL